MRLPRARAIAPAALVAIAAAGAVLASRAAGPRVPVAAGRGPEPRATRVHLASDGRVWVAAGGRASVALAAPADLATRAAVREAIGAASPSGSASVEVVATSETNWAHVLEVVAIARGGGHRTIRLARADAPDDGVALAVAPGVGIPPVFGGAWTLPIGWVRVGWVAAGGREATATLEVRFVVVDVPVDDVGAFPADLDALPWRTAWAARADMRGLVEAARRHGERVEHVVLDVPPALRRRVTFGGVFEVLHGLADAGLETIAPRDA